MTGGLEPWPTRIEVKRSRKIVLCAYDDGVVHEIPFSRMRAMTPSAEARGHGGDLKTPLPGDYSRVDILAADAIGAYAVRFVFSDGHDSGIYTWDRLRLIGDPSAAV